MEPNYRGNYLDNFSGNFFPLESGQYPPLVISAPDGAFVGSIVFVSGGTPVIFDIGDPMTEYEGYEDGAVAYRIYRNGSPVGDWFFADSFEIPSEFLEGDVLTVRDYAGNESNPLVVSSEVPEGAITYGIPYLSYGEIPIIFQP